jgi:carnosine N-methyltransferase
MALRYILNPLITTRPLAHTIQPWAHRFSHQYTADAAFRQIAFPDALPRLSKGFHLIEGDFNKVTPPSYVDGSRGYDYIVTIFFIDTSHNVAGTLKHIHSLLKPGGRWINLGPLLWASGGSVALELSLEEVKRAAEVTGFILDTGTASDGTPEPLKGPRAVPCEYTGDSVGMFKRLYQAEFWTATKAA